MINIRAIERITTHGIDGVIESIRGIPAERHGDDRVSTSGQHILYHPVKSSNTSTLSVNRAWLDRHSHSALTRQTTWHD